MIPLAAILPTEGEAVRRVFLWVALLAAVSKLAVGMLVFSHNPQAVFESSDSHEYHQLALNLIHHATFSRSVSPPFQPETIRTPGYPFFLSLLYEVVGVRPYAVVAIQIALSVVTMFAGYRIASLIFGAQAGLLTAVFLALDPLSVYYAQVMLTETLFGTTLTLSVLGMVHAVRRPSLIYPCWSGICLAAATYTRPTGYYLGMLLPVMLFLADRRTRGWRRAVASAALMSLFFALPVAGWQIRNYVRTGEAEFSQAKNQYLFIAKAAGIVAIRDGLSLEEAQQRLAQQHAASLPSEFPRSSEAAVLESEGRFAQAIVAAHPMLFMQSTLQGIAANLFGPSNFSHLFGSDNVALRQAFLRFEFARFPLRDWFTALGSWTFGLLFLAVLYGGGWLLVKQKTYWNWESAFLVVTAAYVIVVSSGPEAYSRFRMPVMPIFCILAAAGYLCRVDRKFPEPPGAGMSTDDDRSDLRLASGRNS